MLTGDMGLHYGNATVAKSTVGFDDLNYHGTVSVHQDAVSVFAHLYLYDFIIRYGLCIEEGFCPASLLWYWFVNLDTRAVSVFDETDSDFHKFIYHRRFVMNKATGASNASIPQDNYYLTSFKNPNSTMSIIIKHKVDSMRLYKRGKTYYVEIKRGVSRSLKTGDKRTAQSLFAEIKQELLHKNIEFLLTEITAKHIVKLKSDCQSRGLTANAVNTYLRHLSACFHFAQKEGLMPNPPDITKLKTPTKLMRVISPDDIQKILTYSKDHEQEMYRIIFFALYTGCRREEIVRLRYEDIKDGCITIP